jgi:hypothetical protein
LAEWNAPIVGGARDFFQCVLVSLSMRLCNLAASATAEITANVTAANASIKIETEKNARAADLASATLRARAASARRNREAALAQLAKERKELHDEMDKKRVATDEPRVCG